MEKAYLNLVREILQDGREEVQTKSLFGQTLRCDLSQGFPLLTHRRIFFRGVVEELLFFISGKTQTKDLETKGVNIWRDNTSQANLDRLGLPYEEGEMGPLYGFQWRNFNGEYRNGKDYRPPVCQAKLDSPSDCRLKIDQLKNLIEGLKKNPSSRRHLMTVWNPLQVNQGVLPPCHVMTQFDLHNDKLSCLLFQRSADLILGVPFNIASYALLTMILAKEIGAEPGELIMNFGNVHIYRDHLKGAQEILDLPTYPFPKLHFRNVKSFNEYVSDDFELSCYEAGPTMKFQMILT